ncbi:MAG: DUF134 domain-containing protein [Ignavibacteriales bacterium]|nr:DUF134 domain-containing protein [Ignavibacteriales bacterium]
MPRPEKKRKIRCSPASYYFKPRGISLPDLHEIELAQDELEAIRLADLNGLFQEEAAVKMLVSRATFGRIIIRAHQKVADAIINGKAIRISETLPHSINAKSKQICSNCGCRSRTMLQNKKCNNCLSNIKE